MRGFRNFRSFSLSLFLLTSSLCPWACSLYHQPTNIIIIFRSFLVCGISILDRHCYHVFVTCRIWTTSSPESHQWELRPKVETGSTGDGVCWHQGFLPRSGCTCTHQHISFPVYLSVLGLDWYFYFGFSCLKFHFFFISQPTGKRGFMVEIAVRSQSPSELGWTYAPSCYTAREEKTSLDFCHWPNTTSVWLWDFWMNR